MNQIDLGGRRAVVTGGAQGIGRAVAERCLASGAAVALWDRDAQLVASTAAELARHGAVHPVRVDIADATDVEAAVASTMEALGGIDILVANAGIAGPNATLWQYPIDAWREILDINLTGMFLCCRAIVPAIDATVTMRP